ncbi:putative glycoside hydrolase family 15 protein [Corynebacterium cystitidis]|uniref:putative glycoside hydrolase family 15 protein n=1 Tax=Corynebacterium cystitidis TaxID=35757 RepID=UPI00211E2E87|nr:putative glycoside hydrolase family 15 protein [Corynebacterium cystitidis]
MAPSLAWIRNGGPISDEELDQALGRFRAVVLQPWECEAASRLKEADPLCTVLAYQCLSSIRDYEPGPIYTSGITPQRARELGTCAAVPEWAGYPGHRQQQVWNPLYQQEWVRNVVGWVARSPFDGVMADNDVFADYYGTGIAPEVLREALTTLIVAAGTELNKHGKLLIPNIAESRRQPGRWAHHASFGGGFEEVWLGWGTAPSQRLTLPRDIQSQAETLRHPGLTIARTAGRDNLAFALAAAWIFAPNADVAVTATEHDGYSELPALDSVCSEGTSTNLRPLASHLGSHLGSHSEGLLFSDLGFPTSEVLHVPVKAHDPTQGAGAFCREFQNGRLAVNLGPEPVEVFGREIAFLGVLHDS